MHGSCAATRKRPNRGRAAPKARRLLRKACANGRPVRWRRRPSGRAPRAAAAAGRLDAGHCQRRLVARAVSHARGAAQPLLRRRRGQARAPGAAGVGARRGAGANDCLQKSNRRLGRRAAAAPRVLTCARRAAQVLVDALEADQPIIYGACAAPRRAPPETLTFCFCAGSRATAPRRRRGARTRRRRGREPGGGPMRACWGHRAGRG